MEAVARETADLPLDQGVTADKVAKRLRLDRSAAWRRLGNAKFLGFVVNLETRKGQPGRYRLTGQEVDAEELLPPPNALVEVYPQRGNATVQPAREATECKEETDCMADRNGLQPAEPGCGVNAIPRATANPLNSNQEVPPVARLQELRGGEEGELSDGDAFARLKDGKWGLQPPRIE